MAVLDTNQLIGMRAHLPKFETFFLSRYFPSQINFESEKVSFDEIRKGVRMAPLVAPVVAGKPNKKAAIKTVTIEPAYVKSHDNIKPGELLKRKAGEPFTAPLSVVERREVTIMTLLEEQEESIIHREEWMAAQAVLTGTITLSGQDYPTQVVDFGRSAANNITLSGGARWNTVTASTFDPTANIDTWADLCSVVADVLIFAPDTWAYFKTFMGVTDALKGENNSVSKLELGPQLSQVIQYKGMFGEYACYVHKGKYLDEAGNEQPFMPSGSLLVGPSFADNVRCYGAIQDADANAEGIVATSRYPSNWTSKNPSLDNLQTQSAPIMALLDADAFCSIDTF